MHPPQYMLPSQVHGFSERGFVLGPLLLQRLTVALSLNASEARSLADELQSFLEHEELRDDGYKVLRNSPFFSMADCPPRNGPSVDAQANLRTLCHYMSKPGNDWYGLFSPEDAAPPPRVAPPPAAPGQPTANGRPDLLIVTGPLGSGKTRLVNGLLARSSPRKALVFINELGDEPLDHLLVREAPPGSDIHIMASGCLCCRLGADFLQILQESLRQRKAGSLDFDWIVVETSGAADPLDIAQSIASNIELRSSVHFQGVCTTVDLRTWRAETVRLTNGERNQLAVANWLATTMGDLLDPEEYPAAVGRIRAAAPWVRTVLGTGSAIEDDLIMAMREQPPQTRAESDALHLANLRGLPRHAEGVTALTLRADTVDMTAIRVFVDLLFLAKGEDILRMKGDLALTDGRHILLQAVKGYVHEVCTLPQAPVPGSRLTVIARNIAPDKVRRLWNLVRHEVEAHGFRSE